MNKTQLKRYAKLLAKVGVNVKKGQWVIVQADLDQPEFVEMVVEELYRAGAGRVIVEWSHQPLAKINYKYANEKMLSELQKWETEKLEWTANELPAMLYLESSDPDGLKGIDQEKFTAVRTARTKVTKPYRDRMECKYQWCIAAVPGKSWAKKVFPHMPASAGMEKMWRTILQCSRAYEGNPIANWQEHNRALQARCAYLNGLGLTSLEYKSSNGTQLRVGLMKKGVFAAGSEKTLAGVEFNPNIPSEECFTSPKAGEAEGIVYSTKPLSWQGQLIRNFSVRFENGRATEVHAAQGGAALKKMISMDEGASRLGECALVPFDSPISNSGVLFYNTLFDENAACHLALGRGFTNCVDGYEQLTDEEMHAMGVNDSMIHVDFMIGNDDLCITGVTDTGARFPVFEGGNWAFKI